MRKVEDFLIASLDQGTTSTRAVVFDAAGNAVAKAARPLPQSFPADGWVEHDAEGIFQGSAAVLCEAIAAAGRAPACLGITNQRETVVVWERATGRPVHPAIVWQDRRTANVCERLKREGAESLVVERTGLLLDPYFSATKIAWILDHVDGARVRAEAGELLAGTVDSWLIWNLTGGSAHVTDATNASRTSLYGLERGDWDDDLCRLFRVPRAMLPEVRDNAGRFGDVDAAVFGTALSISGVAGDQHAALMGQGGVHAGVVKATYGTGCFLLAHTGERRPRSGARLLVTVAARAQGRHAYALEGAIFSAGSAVDWTATLLGLPGAAAVEALARTAPDGPVTLVPAFTGLGAPWWDAEARGALFNLTRDTGPAQVARAAFDACAWQTRDLIEAIRHDAPDAVGEGAELRIDGGMAVSRWFAQRLADVTGMTVARAERAEATALGAALFAGLGAGLYTSPEEAAERRAPAERFTPRAAPDASAVERWRDAVRRTLRGA